MIICNFSTQYTKYVVTLLFNKHIYAVVKTWEKETISKAVGTGGAIAQIMANQLINPIQTRGYIFPTLLLPPFTRIFSPS